MPEAADRTPGAIATARPGEGGDPMKTVYWNFDKPHRCPECHTVVDAGRPTARAAVYECCACGTRFARWPRLAWLLPVRRCKDIAAGRCPHQAGT